MKIVTLSILLLFVKVSISQITITQNHLPTVNDTIHYKYGNIYNFDPDATGINYTWDFSSIHVSSTKADTIISVTQTPIVYNVVFNFLIANQAYINQTPPSIGQGFTVSDYYDFYKKANNYYRKAGFGATINGVQTPVKYDNPELFFKLPLTYGTTDSSVSQYGLPIPGYGYYGQTIHRKHLADGWGTLITPYGIYPAIRVKHTVNITDTIFSEALNFGYTISRPTSYEYYWLTSTNIRAFAAKVVRNGMFYTIEFYYDPTTVVDNNEMQNFFIFPNPVRDKIYFENPFHSAFVQLFTLSGQLIKTEPIAAGYQVMDISFLPAGIYLLKIVCQEQVKILKIVRTD